MSSNPVDSISVCVCTYRRPALLDRLLDKLQYQATEGKFSYSVVVVENDPDQSARSTVLEKSGSSRIPIHYYFESERSISLARNMSVGNATGNLIAFVDDDEFPDAEWLLTLYNTLKKSAVDGVLGPVLPHFDNQPPRWLVRSGVVERERFSTGTILPSSKYTRTGNVLLWKYLFVPGDVWFDPAYGRIGGGDAEFFDRMMKKGRKFAWCDEAPVYETVPELRQKRMYYIRRAFVRGMTNARNNALLSMSTLKSVIAIAAYACLLAVFAVTSHSLFMKYLIKGCDHTGKILAYVGMTPVKERPY